MTIELSTILIEIFQSKILTAGHIYDADYHLIQVKNLEDNYDYLYSWKIITIVYDIIFLFNYCIMCVFFFNNYFIFFI